MAEWNTVRAIALSLPDVEASAEDRVAFRVRGKVFAWAARERDGGGLAVRVEREEKELILSSSPEVYFSSPHYDGWPGVQIRLEAIGEQELRGRLEDAWLIQAPKGLAKAYLAERSSRDAEDRPRRGAAGSAASRDAGSR